VSRGSVEDSNRVEFAVGLTRIVALYDEETATHLRATAALSRRTAAKLGLSHAVVAAAELTGLLHDIGKVAVDRNILLKPAELDAGEWEIMRLHSGYGADMLAGIPKLAGLAPLVRAHHERMDGGGYPDGLRGDEIPLESRIVAVADAFHALTTDRPYRRAVMPNLALRVLHDCAGPQFDHTVVAAICDVFHHVCASRCHSA
jgi:two-component system cell cycle response regulator